MCGITVSAARHSVVDFTFPHWIEPSAVAIKLHSNRWYYFLDPLQPQLYLAYMNLPLVLGLVLGLYEWMWAWIHRDKPGLCPANITCPSGLCQHIIVYTGNVFYQGV